MKLIPPTIPQSQHIMSPESLEHDKSSDLDVVKRLSPCREGQLLGANRIRENLDKGDSYEERDRRAAKVADDISSISILISYTLYILLAFQHYSRTGEYGFHIDRAHNSRKMFDTKDHLHLSEGMKAALTGSEAIEQIIHFQLLIMTSNHFIIFIFHFFIHLRCQSKLLTIKYVLLFFRYVFEDETETGSVFTRHSLETGDASYVKVDELGDEDHVFAKSKEENTVGDIRHTRRAYVLNRSTRPW